MQNSINGFTHSSFLKSRHLQQPKSRLKVYESTELRSGSKNCTSQRLNDLARPNIRRIRSIFERQRKKSKFDMMQAEKFYKLLNGPAQKPCDVRRCNEELISIKKTEKKLQWNRDSMNSGCADKKAINFVDNKYFMEKCLPIEEHERHIRKIHFKTNRLDGNNDFGMQQIDSFKDACKNKGKSQNSDSIQTQIENLDKKRFIRASNYHKSTETDDSLMLSNVKDVPVDTSVTEHKLVLNNKVSDIKNTADSSLQPETDKSWIFLNSGNESLNFPIDKLDFVENSNYDAVLKELNEQIVTKNEAISHAQIINQQNSSNIRSDSKISTENLEPKILNHDQIDKFFPKISNNSIKLQQQKPETLQLSKKPLPKYPSGVKTLSRQSTFKTVNKAPNFHSFMENQMTSEELTGFPVIALRDFDEFSDFNYDRDSEVLVRVLKSNFEKIFVIRKLEDENDVEDFLKHPVAAKSRLFSIRDLSKETIEVKRLNRNEIESHFNDANELKIEDYKRNALLRNFEDFSIQLVDKVSNYKIITTNRPLDVQVAENSTNHSKFIVSRKKKF